MIVKILKIKTESDKKGGAIVSVTATCQHCKKQVSVGMDSSYKEGMTISIPDLHRCKNMVTEKKKKEINPAEEYHKSRKRQVKHVTDRKPRKKRKRSR